MLNWESMIYALPEDVLKRKWAGDFEGEIELIDEMLARDIPAFLKKRLQVERFIAERLPKEYIYSRDEALALMREKIPDFRDEELDLLEMDRAVEYIYVKGEKRYHSSFRSTILNVKADYARRAGRENAPSDPDLNETMHEMKQKGTLAYRIRLKGTLKITEESFVYRAPVLCYLPIPRPGAQISDVRVEPCAASLDKEDAPQRTALFHRSSEGNEPFVIEYSYTDRMHFVDLLSGEAPAHPVYPDVPAPTADDLGEQLPHIAFTPALRELARELMGEERDKVHIAWRFYDFITTHIQYSYMRSYALIENQAEYCALSGKGDCGIQALLFITLCRIAGIPARWQSGLSVDRKDAGCHDWAQFYVEPWGWVFCDPSYGGSARRKGFEERRRFYFGNLDPFRMVANCRYQTQFDPPVSWPRLDPYDNQSGEVCVGGRGLGRGEFETDYETLELTRLD